jgi:hypothetical protein
MSVRPAAFHVHAALVSRGPRCRGAVSLHGNRGRRHGRLTGRRHRGVPRPRARPGSPRSRLVVRFLIKGGGLLTLDRTIGDFESADILIEGKTISAVRATSPAPNAEIIDAGRMIVTPALSIPSSHVAGHPGRRAICWLARRLATFDNARSAPNIPRTTSMRAIC